MRHLLGADVRVVFRTVAIYHDSVATASGMTFGALFSNKYRVTEYVFVRAKALSLSLERYADPSP